MRTTLVEADLDALTHEIKECVVTELPPHAGAVVGCFEQHGCQGGFLCEKHYGALCRELDTMRHHVQNNGSFVCEFCGKSFQKLDSLLRVWKFGGDDEQS